MFRFENENYLYALLLIPVLLLLYWLVVRWRKKALVKFGDAQLVSQLMPDFSWRRQGVKFALYIGILALVIVGLANPQIGTKLEKVKRQGVDVIVAMDVSNSMLAEDISPSRLDRSKQIVSRLIDNLKNDRIGLIVFAGNAYLQMPLTIDYAAAKLFLKTMNPEIMPSQGTAIGDAISLAKESFDQEEKKFKTLIIITDGENHEGEAIDAAEEASAEGIIVHTLGIGSENGAPIPQYVNGRKRGYKRDKNNQEVISKINEEMLETISEVGGGQYYRVKGKGGEVNKIISELDSMEKKDFEERVFTDYADQFQYFIGFALLLLLIEFFISERSRGWFKNWSLFGETK